MVEEAGMPARIGAATLDLTANLSFCQTRIVTVPAVVANCIDIYRAKYCTVVTTRPDDALSMPAATSTMLKTRSRNCGRGSDGEIRANATFECA